MKILNFAKCSKPASISQAIALTKQIDIYMPPYLVEVDPHRLLVEKYAKLFNYQPPANPPANPGYIYSVNLAAAQIREQMEKLEEALNPDIPESKKSELQKEVWREVVENGRPMYMFAVYPGMTHLTTVTFIPIMKIMKKNPDGTFHVRVSVNGDDYEGKYGQYDYCDVVMKFNHEDIDSLYKDVFAEMKRRNQEVFDTMMTNAALISPWDPLNIFNQYATKYGNPLAPEDVKKDDTRTRLVSYLGGAASVNENAFMDASCGRTGPHEGEYVLRVHITRFRAGAKTESSDTNNIFYRVPNTLAALTAAEHFFRRQYPGYVIRQVPMTKVSEDEFDLVTPRHIVAAMLSHYEAGRVVGWSADFGKNGTGRVYEFTTDNGYVTVLLLDSPQPSNEVEGHHLLGRIFSGSLDDLKSRGVTLKEKIYEQENPKTKISAPKSSEGVKKKGLILLRLPEDITDEKEKKMLPFPVIRIFKAHQSSYELARAFVTSSPAFSMDENPEIVALMGLEAA